MVALLTPSAIRPSQYEASPGALVSIALVPTAVVTKRLKVVDVVRGTALGQRDDVIRHIGKGRATLGLADAAQRLLLHHLRPNAPILAPIAPILGAKAIVPGL